MTTSSTTIGIIGGGGWLGRAFGRAMLESTFADPRNLILSSRSGHCPGYEAWPDVRLTSDNRQLAVEADVIILSVRPEDFDAIGIDASGKLVISFMAGVRADTIARNTRTQRVVRAMPNAAAEIGRSYTPWFSPAQATADDRTFAQSLLETCGEADEMPEETDIDYMSGLTGSGPAFPALMAEAMIGHAVTRGIPAPIARRAVKAVIAGASQLLAREDADATALVDTFMSYKGTTAAALAAMQENGIEAAIHAGLDAAETRALDMSSRGKG